MILMKCALLGSWSWWTALAQVLACNWNNACLWSIHDYEVDYINNHKSQCFPWVELNDNVSCSLSFADVLDWAEMIVLSLPSFAIEEGLSLLKNNYKWELVILATKWWRRDEFKPLSTLVKDYLWDKVPLVVLSWASHAEEVVRKIPTWVVLAGENFSLVEKAGNAFQNDWFRCDLLTDIVWVQLCWALKNVLALAWWLSDGLWYWINTKALLFTKWLHEIILLGKQLWVEVETLISYAWVWDVYVTCSSSLSRNWNAWNLIAQGKIEALKERKVNWMVCEWIYMLDILEKYIGDFEWDFPLINLLIAIIINWEDPRVAFDKTLAII